jgi:hypothetical protein
MNFNFLFMNRYSYIFVSSPDGSDILFLFAAKKKKIQRTAGPDSYRDSSKFYLNKFLSNTILIASA